MKGIAHVGSWQGLCDVLRNNDRNPDEQIKRLYGSSAGSLMAFFVCLRCSMTDMVSLTVDGDHQHMIEDIDVSQLLTKWGVYDKRRLRRTLESLCRKYVKTEHITFAQLKQMTGRSLCVSVSCVDTAKCEIHCPETTPEYLVVSSVLASMSVPVLCTPEMINGRLYTDGSILNNIPMPESIEEQRLTIVFRLTQNLRNDKNEPAVIARPTSVWNYLLSVAYLPLTAIERNTIAMLDPEISGHVVSVHVSPLMSTFDVRVTREIRMHVLENATRNFIGWTYPALARQYAAEIACQLHETQLID